MTRWTRPNGRLWRPQSAFSATLGSRGQLAAFNDSDGAAVNFDVLRSRTPDIVLRGAKNESFCLWETRSASGFVTQPRYNARLVTIRFVTAGQITYRHRRGAYQGHPHLATFIGFDDIRQVEASHDFGALSATIAFDMLAAAYGALTGDAAAPVPRLEPVAEVTGEGMWALFHTVARMQRRIAEGAEQNAHILPMLQEVMSYQLLSAWPKSPAPPPRKAEKASRSAVQAAMDYVEAYAAKPLSLAEIAAAADVSVQSLQRAFRAEIGQSLAAFVIGRRATGGRGDLAIPVPSAASAPNKADRRPDGTGAPPPRLQATLEGAHRLIERELHRSDLNPARVAAQLGISVRKLHLLFEPSGQSFSRRVLARRLAHADRLLRETPHMPVTQAAYAAGFESLSTFFRCYRAAYGVSPGGRRSG